MRTSRRIQRAFIRKDTQLLLYGEVMATYCENHKKIRQAMYYKVKLRRIRVTIVAVGKQKALHTLSVCLYP